MYTINPKTVKIDEIWICTILPEDLSRENAIRSYLLRPKTVKIDEIWICRILPEGISRENTAKRTTYDLMVQTTRFFNRNVGVKKSK